MLISTSEELSAIVGSNISNEFGSVAPALDFAEQEYIVPAIGLVYDRLHTKYQNNEIAADTFEAKLLKLLQFAIANLGYAGFSDIGQLLITDKGFHKVRTDTQWIANENDLFKANTAFAKKGFYYLELAIKLMVEKRTSEGIISDDPKWIASQEYKNWFNTLLPYTTDFSKFEPIADRATLNQLRPIITQVTEEVITANITEELLEELLTKIAAQDLDENFTALLHKSQKVVVKHTMLRAIDKLIFKITPNGLMVTGIKGDSIMQQTPSDVEHLKSKTAYNQEARGALLYLRNWLNQQATTEKFTAYFNSNLYMAPGTIIETNNGTGKAKTWRAY